jgi:hypothetical protein
MPTRREAQVGKGSPSPQPLAAPAVFASAHPSGASVVRHLVVGILGCAIALSSPGPALATEVGTSRNLGLGLAVGTQTSLVGKYLLDRESAFDFGLSFWRWRRGCWRDNRGALYCDRYGYGPRYGGLGLTAGYLWQDNLVRGSAELGWHIGAGGRVWFWDDYDYDGDNFDDDSDIAFALRMPVGLDLTFARPSFLEVFVEMAPALYVFPAVDLHVEGFIGARLYF